MSENLEAGGFLATPKWWVQAIRGVLAVIFGLIIIIWPGVSLALFVLIFGVYALMFGLFALAAAFTARGNLVGIALLVIEGLVGITVGIITFVWPGVTLYFILLLIAIWAILTGILEIVLAIWIRKSVISPWLLLLGGILSVILGIFILRAFTTAALVIVLLIGFYAIIFGLTLIIYAFMHRSYQKKIQT